MDLAGCQVFFDFDNTITSFDVLDDLIARFSVDKEWQGWEKKWQAGKIGSHKCLREQFKSVRIGKDDLRKYLSHIKIDPYFLVLLREFKDNNIQSVIVSDSFLPLIAAILESNKVKGLKIYANRLRLVNNRLIPFFPYKNETCSRYCGHCKKDTLLQRVSNGKTRVYIGDGSSDICPSRHADLVFAKEHLWQKWAGPRKQCIPIQSLRDVYHYFKKALP